MNAFDRLKVAHLSVQEMTPPPYQLSVNSSGIFFHRQTLGVIAP